jgi:hypothetical protein
LKRAAVTACFVSVAGVASVSRTASAQAEPAPELVVALDYAAPTGCPDAASFRSQVLGRTRRMRFADAGSAAPLTWSVGVVATSSGSRGTLRVSGTRPGDLTRSVTATSCEQVVRALGLVAALSVDPDASLAAPERPPPAPPPFGAAPPSTAPAPRTTRATSGKRATKLSVGLTLTGRSGVAPRFAWAPRPFVGISFRAASGYTWGIDLSAMQTHGSAAVDIGKADFTWTTARLETFPMRFSYGRLRFEPALLFESGQLRARGVAISPAAEVRRPALFAGGQVRLSWLAVDRLLLQLEAGPLVSLLRDRFYLRENTTIFRLPALTGFVAGGVGVEFL